MNISILKLRSSLIDELGICLRTLGHNTIITSDNSRVPRNTQLLIRWGNLLPLNRNSFPNLKFRLNKPAAIRAASHKFEAIQKFKNGGLLVPVYNVNSSSLQYPQLGRSNYHSKGKDIKLILQPNDVKYYKLLGYEFDYFLEYIQCEREYRVHIFQDKAIHFNKKLFDVEQNRFIPWIRNHDNGFIFGQVQEPYIRMKLEEVGKKALQLLGLNFGAVDILRSTNNEYYVLEVNTAPGIPTTFEAYAQAIHNLTRTTLR